MAARHPRIFRFKDAIPKLLGQIKGLALL